ncbi:uncharacterized protein LOC144165752 [Haemaphysalis longicornis]
MSDPRITVGCTNTTVWLPNTPNLFQCLNHLDVCDKPVVTLGTVLRGLLVMLSCLLAVLVQVLRAFLGQNLGGLGGVAGDLLSGLQQGLSPVLVNLGVALEDTIG